MLLYNKNNSVTEISVFNVILMFWEQNENQYRLVFKTSKMGTFFTTS